MALEHDLLWELVIEEDDAADLETSSLVRIYLNWGTSYTKTWWWDSKKPDRNKEVLYRIEEFLDVSGKCEENIDLKKFLQVGSEQEEEELVTFIADKILYPLEPVASREVLKNNASVLIRRCRDRLILLTNDNPNNSNGCCSNSKLFWIGVAVRIQLSVTLGVDDLTRFLDCLKQQEEGGGGYDSSSPMPLPMIVPEGYYFFQLGGGAKEDEEEEDDEEEVEEEKTCTICFDKYEPKCQMIRLQCLDELLPDREEHNHKAEAAAAMLLPCYHIFHAKCIADWFQAPGHRRKRSRISRYITCPLCRFKIPSHRAVFTLLHLFPLKLMDPTLEHVEYMDVE